MLNMCDLVINPLVKPAHFELSDAIEKILKYFESPGSARNVAEPDLVDFFGSLQGFVHHHGCNRHAKEQGKAQLVEKVDEDNYDVETLEDEAEVAIIVVV